MSERIRNINFNRVEWCCRDFGIDVENLPDEVVGLTESALDRLRSDSELTYKQLKALADYFHRGVLFFLDDGAPVVEKVHSPQFRTISNQSPDLPSEVRRLIKRVERHRDIFLSLNDEADIQEFIPPKLKAPSPHSMAEATRIWLSLPEKRTFEVYRSAIERKGVLVFRTNGYAGEWQIPKLCEVTGFSLYFSVCPVIVVRKTNSEARQSFTLMHELAHLILHGASSIDTLDTFRARGAGIEAEANIFAGLVLINDEELSKANYKQLPSKDVSEYDDLLKAVTSMYGVSTEVVLRRLVDTGKLHKQYYAAYRAWKDTLPVSEESKGSRLYRHREPSHLFGRPFVASVLNALSRDEISLSKASSFLDNISLKDIHKLEDFVALS